MMVVVGLVVACHGADEPAEAQRKQCRRQLLLLRDALENYREQQGDWPASLTNLMPQYVTDGNLLYCPRNVRPGKEGGSRYEYEFSLSGSINALESVIPGGIKRKKREWKERQISLVGDAIPLVRCLAHGEDRVLNLPLAGPIYESEKYWEKKFTNEVMTLAGFDDEPLFALEAAVYNSLTPRDPKATPAQVNLEGYYNLRLDDPLIARVAPGAGFLSRPDWQFDARGAIQLRFSGTNGQPFPKNVLAISINAKCQRLHFLHGISEPLKPGTIVARYLVRDLRGRLHPMPVAYGRDLVAAGPGVEASPGLAPPRVIEIAGDAKRPPVKLCLSTWINPSPDVAIASVDLRSEVTSTAPFILAITAE